MGHKLKDGEGRVLRADRGRVSVTDGPYAEAREVIGGLFVVDAASYDQCRRFAPIVHTSTSGRSRSVRFSQRNRM